LYPKAKVQGYLSDSAAAGQAPGKHTRSTPDTLHHERKTL